MRMFLYFVKKVVFSFVFVITGSVLALYYIFAKDYFRGSPFANKIDIAVVLVGFTVACYLVWKEEYLERGKLGAQLKDLQDIKPKYEFKIIKSSMAIKRQAAEVDGKIRYAEEKRRSAPKPNPWMPAISLHQEPTTAQWDSYIKELGEYKKHLMGVAEDGSYNVVNFTLENKGHLDHNINIHIKFENTRQIVDYYEKEIDSEEPREPSSILSIVPAIARKVELGLRREVHIDQEEQIEIEVNRLHKGEKVNLHYNPIFLVPEKGKKPIINYCVKSDNHQSSEYKKVYID